jgi:transposase-like protein
MADDTCGAETRNDEPCQHPTTDDGDPDRCWIDAHNEADVEADQPGRPSLLEEYEEQILTGARQGMTLEGCARLAGIDESTLHRWKNKYDDFRKSLRRARAHGELQHLRSVNESGSRFILERSFGYTKTEKREIEADVDKDTTLQLGGEERDLALETIRQLQEQASDE